MQKKIRECYLDRLDDRTWDEEDPRLDFGPAAMPQFIAAFDSEIDRERRWRLIRCIWQFRDRAALPTLAVALRDTSEQIWKESLDGIVCLGGEEAISLLRAGQADVAAYSDAKFRLEWIAEAIEQIEAQQREQRCAST